MIYAGVFFLLAVMVVVDYFPISKRGGCGPTSLYAICQYYHVPATPESILTAFRGDGQLTSFAELKIASERLGLRAEGFRMTPQELQQTKCIGILHINGGHFVALIGSDKNGFRIADPYLSGKTDVSTWPYEYLAKSWDGRVLVITKRSDTVATSVNSRHILDAAHPPR